MNFNFKAPPLQKFRTVLIYGNKESIGQSLANIASQFYLSLKGVFGTEQITLKQWRHYVDELIAGRYYLPEQQLLLLEGFPRTLEQAKKLDAHIEVCCIIVLEEQENSKDKEIKETLSHYPRHLVSTFSADQHRLEIIRDILVDLSDILCISTRVHPFT